MSRLILGPSRLRSCLRAALLPFAVGLLLIGLPGNPLQGQGPDRIKAPDFDGAVGTIGSDKPIRLKDLRGKIVVLEFWTLC
jgi:hypothetical protein